MPIIVSGVRQKAIGVITLIVIFTIIGSLIIFKQPPISEHTAYETQVQEIFEDAKIQFELIRNVTLPSDITLYICTKQQAIDRWGQEPANSDNNVDNSFLRQENIYKSLFLMEENESLNDVRADWVAGWTAVTVGHEIYVIYENFWPWDMPNAEATLIHELTHVWQTRLPTSTSYDNEKAQNALIEGDASYMADCYKTQYNSNIPVSNSRSSQSFSLNINNYLFSPSHTVVFLSAFSYVQQLNSVYPNVPDAVTNLNWFPYIQGKTFVSAIINDSKGSWDRLDQCYTLKYIPVSTAQILHPNKYFLGETPKNPIAPTLNDNSWTIIPSNYGSSSDTYGEYFIYIMLNHWLNNDSQAQKVATGWNGDTFTYYQKDNNFLFTWNITWNSTQDAAEFNKAFTDMMNLTQAPLKNNNQWITNNRQLTLIWDPNTTETIIICCSITGNQIITTPMVLIK